MPHHLLVISDGAHLNQPRNGKVYGKPPNLLPAQFKLGAAPAGKSEDCLYLNVWTPAKSASDRIPVLVWIYGGGFNGGSTSEPTYSGENLAKKGVVLVSIAYRVGQLGFLAHPDLSAESPRITFLEITAFSI